MNREKQIYPELLTVNKIIDENLIITNYFAILNDIIPFKIINTNILKLIFAIILVWQD